MTKYQLSQFGNSKTTENQTNKKKLSYYCKSTITVLFSSIKRIQINDPFSNCKKNYDELMI
jgi:hypothetical protein